MGTFLIIVLGGPAVFAVGWQLVRPSQAVIDAASTERAAERQPREARRPLHDRDSDAYAEAINFTTDVDNGVRTHHDDEEAA